jgi:hypothetical protein
MGGAGRGTAYSAHGRWEKHVQFFFKEIWMEETFGNVGLDGRIVWNGS